MRFVRMADSFVNIEDIHIDLIDQVNPFQKAFEVSVQGGRHQDAAHHPGCHRSDAGGDLRGRGQ